MIRKEDIKTMGKAELMDMIHGVGRETARELINLVISHSRNISLEDAKKKRLLLKHEAIEIIDFFGFEIG